jgi:predicted alpha/beta-fold hydrolase
MGVSLGANALLRWLEESGRAANQVIVAAVSICAPVDLAASGRALERGLSRWVYTPMFLQTMKPKAMLKWEQHPGLFNKARMLNARTLFEFDDVFTAPLHGFQDASDYWARASSKLHLQSIHTPTLILNAQNDPFVPASSLPIQQDLPSAVTLWQPATGGHVGFPTGKTTGSVCALPEITGHWLQHQVTV